MERVVFLDRSTIGPTVTIGRPGFAHDWVEHQATKPDEVVERLAGATIAITNKRVLIDAGPGGTPDGMRCDMDGNLWCGWGMGTEALDGVSVFAPDGTKIGRIALPERCANVCFGGRKRNRLFMAASQSLYALYVNTQGALGG